MTTVEGDAPDGGDGRAPFPMGGPRAGGRGGRGGRPVGWRASGARPTEWGTLPPYGIGDWGLRSRDLGRPLRRTKSLRVGLPRTDTPPIKPFKKPLQMEFGRGRGIRGAGEQAVGWAGYPPPPPPEGGKPRPRPHTSSGDGGDTTTAQLFPFNHRQARTCTHITRSPVDGPIPTGRATPLVAERPPPPTHTKNTHNHTTDTHTNTDTRNHTTHVLPLALPPGPVGACLKPCPCPPGGRPRSPSRTHPILRSGGALRGRFCPSPPPRPLTRSCVS